MTLAAASATQPSMTRRRPKRTAAAGAANVPAMPPSAEAATIQPITSGPQPRALKVSAVSGNVLPSPMPRTATLKVTAAKSRQACFRAWPNPRTAQGAFGSENTALDAGALREA